MIKLSFPLITNQHQLKTPIINQSLTMNSQKSTIRSLYMANNQPFEISINSKPQVPSNHWNSNQPMFETTEFETTMLVTIGF